MGFDKAKIKQYLPYAVVGSILGGVAFFSNKSTASTTSNATGDPTNNDVSASDLQALLDTQATNYTDTMNGIVTQANAAQATDAGNITALGATITTQGNALTSLQNQYSTLYNKVFASQAATAAPPVATTVSKPPATSSPTTAWTGQTYSSGSNNPIVALIQHQLENKGYSTSSTGKYVISSADWDSQYGAHTTSAVKQYQLDHGLSADGVVGQSTWNSLFS